MYNKNFHSPSIVVRVVASLLFAFSLLLGRLDLILLLNLTTEIHVEFFFVVVCLGKALEAEHRSSTSRCGLFLGQSKVTRQFGFSLFGRVVERWLVRRWSLIETDSTKNVLFLVLNDDFLGSNFLLGLLQDGLHCLQHFLVPNTGRLELTSCCSRGIKARKGQRALPGRLVVGRKGPDGALDHVSDGVWNSLRQVLFFQIVPERSSEHRSRLKQCGLEGLQGLLSSFNNFFFFFRRAARVLLGQQRPIQTLLDGSWQQQGGFASFLGSIAVGFCFLFLAGDPRPCPPRIVVVVGRVVPGGVTSPTGEERSRVLHGGCRSFVGGTQEK